MWKYIRRKLRLYEIQEDQTFLSDKLDALAAAIDRKTTQETARNLALGRIIAKLDPAYGRSEFDNVRKAESDRLGQEALDKLLGEAQALRKHNP